MSHPPFAKTLASALPEDEFTLDHFLVGARGKIVGIQADPELMQRLAALGLRMGCTVQMLRKASLGGPVQVRVGTTEVIMRQHEAKRILAVPMVDMAEAPSLNAFPS